MTCLKSRRELTAVRHWSRSGVSLDLATAPQVAEVLDGLAPDAEGVRHIVLDVRGLTFMDASGTHG